jgi:hypothetical protein
VLLMRSTNVRRHVDRNDILRRDFHRNRHDPSMDVLTPKPLRYKDFHDVSGEERHCDICQRQSNGAKSNGKTDGNRRQNGLQFPKPPSNLGKTGADLWNRVHSESVIDDVGGVETLAQICAAADRAAELGARITADGAVIRVKGIPRPHPCLRDELAARAFVVRGLARLGLTLEPLKPVGRPGLVTDWTGDRECRLIGMRAGVSAARRL